MSTPTIFSDVAGTANNKFTAKSEPQGILAQKFILSLPATTAADIDSGLIRFETGFSLVRMSLAFTDMDAGTDLLFDVGFLLDGTTGEDDNAFLDNLDTAQAGGSDLWPVVDGLLTGISFKATGPGYITATTRANTVETAGTITGIIEFTYDL